MCNITTNVQTCQSSEGGKGVKLLINFVFYWLSNFVGDNDIIAENKNKKRIMTLFEGARHEYLKNLLKMAEKEKGF